jgi:hypothetical protein
MRRRGADARRGAAARRNHVPRRDERQRGRAVAADGLVCGNVSGALSLGGFDLRAARSTARISARGLRTLAGAHGQRVARTTREITVAASADAACEAMLFRRPAISARFTAVGRLRAGPRVPQYGCIAALPRPHAARAPGDKEIQPLRHKI